MNLKDHQRDIDQGAFTWQHVSLLLLLCFACPMQPLHAQSATEVEVRARGGTVLQVVPLHASAAGLLVDRYFGDWSADSNSVRDGVLFVRWSQVDSVIVPAETETMPYALALIKGFLWSVPAALVGGFIGEKVCGTGREDRDCVLATGLTAGAAGLIAGTIYNWPDAKQDVETVYHPSNPDDREMLRELCVYPGTLPASLRAILPEGDEK